MIKLYDFPMSPRARKPRIVLAEKGLQYEKVNIDITKGEQKKPEYLAINPYGKVPALQDNGMTVYESSIVMEYLNDKYPNPPLMPADAGQRARARVLMHLGDNAYDGALGAIVGEVFFKLKGQADQNVIAKAKQDLTACFERLERELGSNDYLVGTFSLADICFATWAPLFGPLQVEVPSQCSKVNAWLARLKERPSVKAAG
ncbi:MAG TPA: glutathione S-transferase family protein [Candidatus Binatia bacterium]|nr:glutathione S-transferase family protein [Candidatus Binatia bacterium]